MTQIDQSSLPYALLLALGAGLAIPLGALLASHIREGHFCRRLELDSFMTYFGGGALLAAITLVLIPRGMEDAPVWVAAPAFALGGLCFLLVDRWTQNSDTTFSLLLGMVLDFLPEAVLLGVAVFHGNPVALLLAILIVLQNTPEAFAAWDEMGTGGISTGRRWLIFLACPLLGPLAAWTGYSGLSGNAMLLASFLLFCSGGVLYLIFQDIAPNAHIQRERGPAVGAISGFLLGLVGTMLIH